jgi:hypothetical protein
VKEVRPPPPGGEEGEAASRAEPVGGRNWLDRVIVLAGADGPCLSDPDPVEQTGSIDDRIVARSAVQASAGDFSGAAAGVSERGGKTQKPAAGAGLSD